MPATLQAISPLLASSVSTISLPESGSLTPIPRHPSFRLFASMNPATDVGKKDLPPVLRTYFTEIWVPSLDGDDDALRGVVDGYISGVSLGHKEVIADVVEFYGALRQLSERREIGEGGGRHGGVNMRGLVRALLWAREMAPTFGVKRAIWEGCAMAFLGALEEGSKATVRALAQKNLLRSVKLQNRAGFLAQVPTLPPGALPSSVHSEWAMVVPPFWLRLGPLALSPLDDSYILTPSVVTKLQTLTRIVASGRFPVLIEGPTSTGKTSAVEYLARRTGHRFVRINNHEHTDLMEYLGAYVSDASGGGDKVEGGGEGEGGKLVFRDGILVRALRRGDWIVLDELNLAPTDVLEALNRLLDDNRELLIPETGELIRPHPHFMLFATQNPPDLYAGRKVLSRAFRSRFLEVRFDDVPREELEEILVRRCVIAPSYGKRIVTVFRDLQARRGKDRVFETKEGFATLRDLFRWAGRGAGSWEELARDGWMLIGERSRRDDDKAVVRDGERTSQLRSLQR